MSKELTEQWRNGTLPVGHYYCKLYYNGFKEEIQKCVKSAYSPESCIPMSCGCEGEEVLASVPTYEEYLKLESDSLAKQEGVELVAELEHRLKEAESVIRLYLREEPPLSSPPWKKYFHAVAKRYLEKYKVEE